MADEPKLTSAEFAAKIKAKYPQYADVPDDELTQKVIAKHPEYGDRVDLTPVAKAPTGTERAMQQTMGGPPMFVDVPKGEGAAFEEAGKKGYQRGAGTGLAMVGSTALPGAAEAVPGAAGVLGRMSLAAAGAIPGVVAGQENPTVESVGKEAAGYGLAQPVAEGLGALGSKASDVASKSLSRILRLTAKSFDFGKEPAEEVLKRGLASGSLKETATSIGEASRQVTSELTDVLKKAPGTVDAFAAGTEASKSIPNEAAASRFEQLVLDAADKLGLKNLGKLSNVEANALKREVAEQARFVEGDMRPSVANAAKMFGGKIKDGLISNAPDAKDLLESSANLTEASKRAAFAVKAEKAGQGKSGLSSVDIEKPGTYSHAITDTITGSKMLFKFANMLKDSGIPLSQALRTAFSFVYPQGSDAAE